MGTRIPIVLEGNKDSQPPLFLSISEEQNCLQNWILGFVYVQ